MSALGKKSLLAIHVATSVALVGSSAELLVTAARAATRSDLQQAHALYALMQLLVFSLGVPLSFVALGTGLWLVAVTRWTLLRDWWVSGKLALLTGTIGVGALATGPMIASSLEASSRAASSSDRWSLVAAIGAQGAMVLAATALAVFKPRTPRRPASSATAPLTNEELNLAFGVSAGQDVLHPLRSAFRFPDLELLERSCRLDAQALERANGPDRDCSTADCVVASPAR